MAKPMILVTGATGKTGAPVVEELCKREFPVRALARRRDDRSERLETLGAEVVLGDLLDLDSLRRAMKGVERVYFCYPARSDGLLEAMTNIAVAARDERSKALVNMSQISARERSASPLGRHHWLSENILDWANIGVSHVRPTFFAENLLAFSGRSIAKEGKLVLAFGEQRHAPVAAEDIARVIVGILTDPERHLGQHYVVTGPREMSASEIADVLTKELGKEVRYVDVPIDEWREMLVDQVGVPEFLATHLAGVAHDYQEGVFSARTDVVEEIGGGPPQPLEEFVRANLAQFTAREPNK